MMESGTPDPFAMAANVTPVAARWRISASQKIVLSEESPRMAVPFW